ncbi:gliding motility protein GldN [Flavobacteriaceae bacterium]|jgi:gliding motility associated protien GldN|nr:gliding motility protein GldN [Flavobacteriaceae bacterium]MDA9810735.1 gliding motility protein GldN [Flavobacteriaceae bacterium]MDB4129238.1 gliding motility protein GldN [Flavobacteriaceae bacterium]MDB4159490.1 gliding motility protein GldN [Flavobacteriaceae bacterium]MDC0103757.1 gliding motility protein GldN [Flavobacteriaceae bacterium]
MKKQVFIVLFTFLIFTEQIFAQTNLLNAKVPQEVGVSSQQELEANNSSPIAYGYVDDRDILWQKTVWETIDLDERINFPYYYPTINNGLLSSTRKSLFRILIDNINSGDITEIYSDSYFNDKLTAEDLEERLISKKLSPSGIEKSNSGEQVTENDYDIYKIETDKVVQYRIKGTWYVNKRLGELKYRLLGIAPVAPDVSTLSDGPAAMADALVPLFWVWFPDARKALNNSQVFNSKNSSQPITFDNMLNSRRFNSVIYQEENVYEDRAVNQYIYEDALRQLLESERIKSEIRDFEQDLWNN